MRARVIIVFARIIMFEFLKNVWGTFLLWIIMDNYNGTSLFLL